MRKLQFNTSMVALLALIIGFSSCKNKKKTSEISDPQEVKAQIEQELGDDDQEQEEQPERKVSKEPTKTQKLDNYFGAIANAPSTASANSSIREALGMFSSPDAPVLIVIYRGDGSTDYDEPTTIRRYLEYLKDTKNDKAEVEEMVMDDYGRIKELVLKK
ncbi:nucleoid-structuring protein H-NS [Marinoscillum furvescens]|uniref:Nucleoid-structuring protein H-NS n=1 Tax=Marinoscillum furvescens DSM 4134 TaxID=1122208 RepID=A0A3D9KW60_MARFU|nr:nucleoid-structuring protein H-NS [Marinoscillum furvescens]RED92061.1 hypothetical protein C7460_13330 [Marinoscillum furvescens DSM 4134]